VVKRLIRNINPHGAIQLRNDRRVGFSVVKKKRGECSGHGDFLKTGLSWCLFRNHLMKKETGSAPAVFMGVTVPHFKKGKESSRRFCFLHD
jgi:hypothetical protein